MERADQSARQRRTSIQRQRDGGAIWLWIASGLAGVTALVIIWLALVIVFPPRGIGAGETTNDTQAEPVVAVTPVPVPTMIVQPANNEPERLPGLPTAAPTPPAVPNATNVASTTPQAAAPQPTQTAPASKPSVPPAVTAPAPAAPAPQRSTPGFSVEASASPTSAPAESAIITVTAAVTNNGAPVQGAFCMATAYFRTTAIKQPEGGVLTGPTGRAIITFDARGATYDRYVPVEVSCSHRDANAVGKTGFTPTKGPR